MIHFYICGLTPENCNHDYIEFLETGEKKCKECSSYIEEEETKEVLDE